MTEPTDFVNYLVAQVGQGAQGPAGPAGPVGPQGIPGLVGPMGPAGTIPSRMRLSASSLPVIESDTTTSVLHYTDGLGSDFTLNIASLAVGQYDVFNTAAGLAVHPINTQRDATWIGSINVTSTGQITCHVSMGQTRQWDIYNVFNQKEVSLTILKVMPSGQAFEYFPPGDYPAWHIFADDPTIKATIFTGSPETVHARYSQLFWVETGPNAPAMITNGIGWNLTSSGPHYPSGTWSGGNIDDSYHATGRTYHSFLTVRNATGINTVNPVITARGPGTVLVYGGDYRNLGFTGTTPDNFMNLTVSWMG